MRQMEMWKVRDVKPYENNPRKNDDSVKAVAESIKQFGFKQPIVVDKDGVIIVGHTRLRAAKRLKMKEVPVLVADDLTEEQAKAYRLADNKVAETSTWDLDKLEEELKDIWNIDMSELGFGDFSDIFPDKDKPDEATDKLTEIFESEECFVEKGDIWYLGRHRLMCGDSTSENDVNRLMDGDIADLVLTDPPYNMALKDEVNDEEETLHGDNMTEEGFAGFIRDAYRNMKNTLKPAGSCYIFHSYHAVDTFVSEFRKSGMIYEQDLVWAKPSFALSGSAYQHAHELILFGRNGGKAADRTWNSGRSDSDVLETSVEEMSREELEKAYNELRAFVKGTVIYADRNTDEKIHITMKPTPLLVELIRNSSNQGELVQDLFSGSGSTIVACEECNRTCYAMEYDELFMTRAIKRVADMIGADKVYVERNGETLTMNEARKRRKAG